MKLKTVLLGMTAAAVSAGVAFAQMQPIPNPPEKPKPAAKHHAKKHHAKKAAAPAAATASPPRGLEQRPEVGIRFGSGAAVAAAAPESSTNICLNKSVAPDAAGRKTKRSSGRQLG